MPSSVSQDVLKMKARNDWLGILQYYHLQALDRDIDKDLTRDEKSEILFAASHWADDVHSRAKSRALAEQALRAYFWCFDQSDKFAEEYPDCFAAQQNDAYLYFELYITLGNDLARICRKLRVDRELSGRLGKYRGAAYDKACAGFKKAIEIMPASMKCQYRLAKIMHRELKNNGYKRSRDDLGRLQKEVGPAYQNALDLYANAANKKPLWKTFIKAMYGKAVFLNDVCEKAVAFERGIQHLRRDEEIWTAEEGRMGNGLTWNMRDLAEAKRLMDIICSELHYEDDPDDDAIKRIASEKEPVLPPMYMYFRRAKIYFVMALVYASGIRKMYKLRRSNKQQCITKTHEYFEKARINCQYAVDVRMTRRSLGFKDTGGIFPEIELLVKIYTVDSNYHIEDIERLIKKYGGDEKVRYFYAIACYVFDAQNHAGPSRALKQLEGIVENSRNPGLRKKAQKTIADIQDGKM